jgi:hypothetical protein
LSRDKRLEFKPGSKYRYSNSDNIVVGLMIEAATGYAVEPPNPPEDGTDLFAPDWAWAAGGIVSTPGDVNRFVRGYASGATTNNATAAKQFKFVKGDSDPPGPGTNEAGLAIFRYNTRCGTVYGHTGNITGGYTQFAAATRDGSPVGDGVDQLGDHAEGRPQELPGAAEGVRARRLHRARRHVGRSRRQRVCRRHLTVRSSGGENGPSIATDRGCSA